MTVCLDTNVFLQIFGRKQLYHQMLRALLDGRLTLAVSNEILLKYQEVTTKLSGAECWPDVESFLELFDKLHRKPQPVSPEDFIREHLAGA